MGIVAAVAAVVASAACAPEENVEVTTESETRTIRAGASDQVEMTMLLDESGFQFVTPPVDVRVIGLDSDVPDQLTLQSDPIFVTLEEFETPETAVITINVLSGTQPGEYHARIIPDSPNEFLEGGEGLELTVLVPSGGGPAPTDTPTTLPTAATTPLPTALTTPLPTPTEECDPDFDEDCPEDPGDCDPDFEDCDGDGVVDDDE
jgi:hypothetical protein